VKKFVLRNVEDKKNLSNVEKSLHELWLLTKDLTSSEESTQLIDDLSIFLLRLFLKQNHVLNKHIAQMKTFFGEVSSKQTNKILQLVTVGGLGIWWLVDLILILTGSFRDGDGRQITEWT